MKVNLRLRQRVKLETIDAGSTFMVVGQRRKLYQVLDLRFKASPALRPDLVYISEVETGIVSAMPKTTEVEEMNVEVSEI